MDPGVSCKTDDKTVTLINPFGSAGFDPTNSLDISFKIDGVKMPPTSAPSGEFQFAAYLIDTTENKKYIVDLA
jgi:hypothetical protein